MSGLIGMCCTSLPVYIVTPSFEFQSLQKLTLVTGCGFSESITLCKFKSILRWRLIMHIWGKFALLTNESGTLPWNPPVSDSSDKMRFVYCIWLQHCSSFVNLCCPTSLGTCWSGVGSRVERLIVPGITVWVGLHSEYRVVCILGL